MRPNDVDELVTAMDQSVSRFARCTVARDLEQTLRGSVTGALAAVPAAYAGLTVLEPDGRTRSTRASWSGSLHTAGNVSCNRFATSPRLIQMWTQGQYPQAGFNWANNYGLDFGNIGGRSSTSVLITCDGWGGRYQFWRSFDIYRPSVGTQLSVHFNGQLTDQ